MCVIKFDCVRKNALVLINYGNEYNRRTFINEIPYRTRMQRVSQCAERSGVRSFAVSERSVKVGIVIRTIIIDQTLIGVGK